MGGYGFGVDDGVISVFPKDTKVLAITARGLECIASIDPSIIPDIDVKDIKDKSKSNNFGKFLHCVSLGWFLIRVMTRVELGLAVPLLESTTSIHVALTIMTLIIWWRKPLDVDRPFVIVSGVSYPLAAFLVLCSAHTLWKSDVWWPEFAFKKSDSDDQDLCAQISPDGTISLAPGQILFGFRYFG
ncbi:uncharacterized protein SETTUDRAFT_165683 [Exserohilum turcica Et28A]|uniref:Uncharacterized protein n=1 Tax=Exserohilum turcicum (strain 28A) TaxID=671987 RepID=R0JLY8_EXST2|nr:uncharacterized protein SETTUDRAFT_165683 [Exserohilum turcica Et28A]EOA82253.1 hypothetical protein SETTUDRAFT_165683 [Exserohilum turcica Et28A]